MHILANVILKVSLIEFQKYLEDLITLAHSKTLLNAKISKIE